MGKGTIVSHIADGEYNVTLNYDSTGIDAQLAVLNQRKTLLIAAIAAETDDLKIRLLNVQLLSVQKRIDYLSDTDHVPVDTNITAWCADLTDDLTGEVGLIEIGREQANGVNIQPGYGDNAVFEATRDGQLTPLMAQTAAATFYNLAMLPGTQKWKPTFLYGVISNIDTVTDTADVTLDAINSSQQSLNIVQDLEYVLTDVPVVYMDCHAAAFTDGDRVIVEFEDYDFAQPKIIGFKDNPQPCEVGPILIVSTQSGAEAIAWDMYNNVLLKSGTFAGITATFSPAVEAVASGTGDNILPNEFSGVFFTKINGSTPYTVDRPVNPSAGQPYFLIDERFFGSSWVVGDTVVFQTFEASTAITIISSTIAIGLNMSAIQGHLIGAIDETWTITIFSSVGGYCWAIKRNSNGEMVSGQGNDGSGLLEAPDSASYLELTGEDGYRGAYLWYYRSQQKGMQVHLPGGPSESWKDLYKNRYESLSEESWPTTDDGIVARERVFLNPVFGVDLYDAGTRTSAYLTSLKAATQQLFDSWEKTTLYEIGDAVGARISHGVSSTDNGDLVFDWTTFCYEFYAACQDYENKFIHTTHIYYRDNSIPSKPGEKSLLELINAERISDGKEVLVANPNLQKAAEKHARWMAKNLTMSHTGNGGSTAEDRILAENYLLWNVEVYQPFVYGENVGALNLAIYTLEEMVAAWMTSPGHAANILYEDYVDTGIGFSVGSDGKTYICQTFGFRQDVWPGFGAFDPTSLVDYVKTNFVFTGDVYRVPKIYLI